MKKLVAICLSIILIASYAIPVCAAEEISGTRTGETELYIRMYSSFDIVMPLFLNLNQATTATVLLQNAYIEEGYKVDIYATNFNEDGGITLTNTNNPEHTLTCMLTNKKEGVTASAEMPLVTFYDTNVSAGQNTARYFDLEIVGSAIPGEYHGTMTYSITCNPY